MIRPTSISFAPGAAVNVSLDVPSPSILAYHLWMFPPGASDWMKIGEGVSNDNVRDRFVLAAVPPVGTWFSLTLAIGGHPHAPWKVDISIDQPAASGTGASWSETGTFSGGNGRWATDVIMAQVRVA
jgi:hypothetical protein